MPNRDMNRIKRHCGITLTELLVVMAAAALLTILAVPAAKRITNSFEAGYGVRKVIGAALSNARAIAAQKGCYAGVRFQQDLNGDQYMIFIIHDPADPAASANGIGTDLANGFRAIEGRKPVKLPQNIGVMDLRIRTDRVNAAVGVDTDVIVRHPLTGQVENALTDLNLDEAAELRDAATFAVVFAPSGRPVIHQVRVRNRNGRNDAASLINPSSDDVFNTLTQVDNGIGVFYQDDYAALGLGQEPSRNCFVIYDKKRLSGAPATRRWTDYLQELDWVYINPHTGELVND